MPNDLGRGEPESMQEDPVSSAEPRELRQGAFGLSAGAVTVIGALIALMSAGVTAFIGGYWQLQAEQWKAKAQLDIEKMQQQFQVLLRATEGLEAERAAKNLKFFVDIGYLEDKTGKILEYATRGEAPKILSQQLQYGVTPGTCIQGYVWRVARSSDLVCVTPDERQQVSIENEQADAHRVPGSDACIADYVFREAFRGDTVCVTPARREQTQRQNALGPSRTVVAD